MTENKSGLSPRGVAVLIKISAPPGAKSTIVIPDSVKDRLNMLDNRAVIIEIGPNAWHDEPTPRAAVGETVLVTKMTGFNVTGTLDGESYRLVNDRDIFCALTYEGAKNE